MHIFSLQKIIIIIKHTKKINFSSQIISFISNANTHYLLHNEEIAIEANLQVHETFRGPINRSNDMSGKPLNRPWIQDCPDFVKNVTGKVSSSGKKGSYFEKIKYNFVTNIMYQKFSGIFVKT